MITTFKISINIVKLMFSTKAFHFDIYLFYTKIILSIRPFPNTSAPRAVALASSACVDKIIKIITEFTRKDPFLHLKRAS